MKLNGILLVAIFDSIFGSAESINYKFEKFEKCQSSDESIAVIKTCEVDVETLNLTVILKRPLKQPLVSKPLNASCSFDSFNVQKVNIALFSRQSSEYHQFFKVPQIEWCKLMSGVRSSNGVIRSLFEAFKECCSEFIKTCPYEARPYEVVNARFNDKMLFIYPPGFFRIDVLVLDETNKNLTIKVSLLLELNTFGL